MRATGAWDNGRRGVVTGRMSSSHISRGAFRRRGGKKWINEYLFHRKVKAAMMRTCSPQRSRKPKLARVGAQGKFFFTFRSDVLLVPLLPHPHYSPSQTWLLSGFLFLSPDATTVLSHVASATEGRLFSSLRCLAFGPRDRSRTTRPPPPPLPFLPWRVTFAHFTYEVDARVASSVRASGARQQARRRSDD